MNFPSTFIMFLHSLLLQKWTCRSQNTSQPSPEILFWHVYFSSNIIYNLWLWFLYEATIMIFSFLFSTILTTVMKYEFWGMLLKTRASYRVIPSLNPHFDMSCCLGKSSTTELPKLGRTTGKFSLEKFHCSNKPVLCVIYLRDECMLLWGHVKPFTKRRAWSCNSGYRGANTSLHQF